MAASKTALMWALLRIALASAVQVDLVPPIEPTLVSVEIETADSTFLSSNNSDTNINYGTLAGLIHGTWDFPESIFDENIPSTPSSNYPSFVTIDSDNWEEAAHHEYDELIRWHTNDWARSAASVAAVLTVALEIGGSGDDDDDDDRRKRRRLRAPRGRALPRGLRSLIRLFYSRYEEKELEIKNHPLFVQHLSNLKHLRHLEEKLSGTENKISAQRQVPGVSQSYEGSRKLRLRWDLQHRRVVNARSKVFQSMQRCEEAGVLGERDRGLSIECLSDIYVDEVELESDRNQRRLYKPLMRFHKVSSICQDENHESGSSDEDDPFSTLPQPVNTNDDHDPGSRDEEEEEGNLSIPTQPANMNADGEWSIHTTLALAAVPYDGGLDAIGNAKLPEKYDEDLPSSFMGLLETPADERFTFPSLNFNFRDDESNWLNSDTPLLLQGSGELDFVHPSDIALPIIPSSPSIADQSGSEVQPNNAGHSFGQYSEQICPSPDSMIPKKSPTMSSDTNSSEDSVLPSLSTKTYLPSPSSMEQLTSTDEGKGYPCSHCTRRYARPSELKKHLKSLSKSFLCPIPDCSRAFRIKKDLDRHLKGPHGSGEKKNVCHHHQCDKKYIRKDALQKHLRLKHGKLEKTEMEQKDNESDKSIRRGLKSPSTMMRSTIQQIRRLKRRRDDDVHHSTFDTSG